MLQQDVEIHELNGAQGLEALRGYSYAFDEDRRTFSDRPGHGPFSHGADAWRYLAMAARVVTHWMRPTPEGTRTEVKPGFYPMRLEELFRTMRKP